MRSSENLSERRVERQSGVVDSIRKRRAGGVCQDRKTRDLTIRTSKRPSATALDMVLAPAIPVTWSKCHNPVVGCAAANHGQPSLTRGKTVSIKGIWEAKAGCQGNTVGVSLNQASLAGLSTYLVVVETPFEKEKRSCWLVESVSVHLRIPPSAGLLSTRGCYLRHKNCAALSRSGSCLRMFFPVLEAVGCLAPGRLVSQSEWSEAHQQQLRP